MCELRGLLGGALATLLTLVGCMAMGVALGNWIFEDLPGHMIARVGLGALPALGGVIAAGAAWGWTMAALFGLDPKSRYVRAGVMGFGLPLIAAALLLFALEGVVLGLGVLLGVREFPVHRLFTLLFVPAAFVLTLLGAYSIGRLVQPRPAARRLARRAAILAALAFLLTNLVMESRGWVVGAPGAAERNTMITVLLYGLIAAALAGGAVLGRGLADWQARQPQRTMDTRTAGITAQQTPRRPATVEEDYP